MTQDEIIDMAREAKWVGIYVPVTLEQIEAFAKLVADKAFQDGYEKGVATFNEAVWLEREACAKVCDFEWGTPSQKDLGIMFAQAIRARGEA